MTLGDLMDRTRFLPILFAAFVMTGAVGGCGLSTGPSSEVGVIGTWTWLESTGGIAGVTLTPASTGESMALRFTLDGQAQLFRNGSLERMVGFATTPGREEGALEVSYDAPLMGFEVQTATFPSGDELVLTDPCCDGFAYRYLRAP